MSRRVYVHIGAPKTGTTYLQDRLQLNTGSLATHDVHIPTRSPLVSTGMFHFRAALDLLGQDWGGSPGHAAGSWDVMVKRVRRLSGTVIISHEILAAAEPEQIARLRHDLVDDGRAELHIVYSARDLGRQVPAGWQESVKQGRRWSYRTYVKKVTAGKTWFARAFDLPTVLTRWGAGLPPERVHVVTVPQQDRTAESGDGTGLEPELLWTRLCTAFGIDPAWAPRDSLRSNTSLGSAETQVLRRLNQRLSRAARSDASYDHLILQLLAGEALAGRSRSPILLPPAQHAWATERGLAWGEWLRESGVDVIGDAADLLPAPVPETYRHPDRVRAKAQLKASLDALAAMTREAASRPDPEVSLRGRVRRLREDRRR